MTAFIGVLISWLTLAKNALLARSALSASAFALINCFSVISLDSISFIRRSFIFLSSLVLSSTLFSSSQLSCLILFSLSLATDISVNVRTTPSRAPVSVLNAAIFFKSVFPSTVLISRSIGLAVFKTFLRLLIMERCSEIW